MQALVRSKLVSFRLNTIAARFYLSRDVDRSRECTCLPWQSIETSAFHPWQSSMLHV